MLVIFLIVLGGLGTLALLVSAFQGPSPGKALKRRVESIKERHGDVIAANAQAQIRKLFAGRDNKVEGFASTIIPKPALLRKRLEMTGRDITLSRYLAVTVGVTAIVMVALMFKGMPFLLGLFAGMFVGIGLPYFIVGRMIKKRVAKFNSNFPDAIELMVRGLRSGLPITETLGIVAAELTGPVGVEFRAVADKMKIGRTMGGIL